MKRNSAIEAFAERPLCNAPTKSGGQCQSRAMRNSSRCRSHGGATPAAVDAARVRALRQADPLMAKLHAIAFNDDMPPQVQLEAIKHALKVTGAFESKQSVEIDLVGKPHEKTFEDWVGDALTDVAEDDDDDPLPAIATQDIQDAEIVTDEEPPLLTRHDRAVFTAVERSQARVPQPARTEAQRRRLEEAERAALAGVPPAEADDRPSRRMTREELLLAKESGYNFSSRGEAGRAAVEDDARRGVRRTRIRDGGLGGR